MSAPESDDRVLLITGASSGIGAATARAAVAADWKVALAARSTDKLSALVDALGADRAIALACDVTNAAQVARMVQAAADFGPLAAVFANAGLGSTRAGVEDGDLDNWRTMLDVNIWGLLTAVHHALPHLRETKGHAILTGSNAGRRPIKGSVYGATKWFVNGFAQNLSAEMAEWGGRCTLLTPGMVDTPFFESPVPGALSADDVARAVMFALDQPAHVNVDEVRVTPV